MYFSTTKTRPAGEASSPANKNGCQQWGRPINVMKYVVTSTGTGMFFRPGTNLFVQFFL